MSDPMILRITKWLRLRWNGLVLGEKYTQSWYEMTGAGWERRSRTFIHKGRKVTFPFGADARQLETGLTADGWKMEADDE